MLKGCELCADQRKAALPADGLIPPKTEFHNKIRMIIPEFAGYGVLLCSHMREVGPGNQRS